ATVLEGVNDDDAAQVGVLLRLWETPSGFAQVGWLTRDPQAPEAAVASFELDALGSGS
ncbi:MAG: hypothetical protein JWM86_37, partial [Thermoleophilia bacterium]|nr:hypothetical protein [Thermoleophilia bacterium]